MNILMETWVDLWLGVKLVSKELLRRSNKCVNLDGISLLMNTLTNYQNKKNHDLHLYLI